MIPEPDCEMSPSLPSATRVPGMPWLSPRLTNGESKDAGTEVSKVNTEGHEKMAVPGQEKKEWIILLSTF